MRVLPVLLIIVTAFIIGCTTKPETISNEPSAEKNPIAKRIPLIFDTDANNELDDQHALAYLLFNSEVFDVLAITANATDNGGEIHEHLAEADRIRKLCKADEIPLLKGANADYLDIRDAMAASNYDGKDAVEFIIGEARRQRTEKLVILAVGKLTNVALAIAHAPDIIEKIKVVWLGSNYPEPGEYNLVNDIPAMNYVIEQPVELEFVMVRYGEPSGSDAVRVTPTQIQELMPGVGPEVDPVTGRHGASFSHFGDYSINLFDHAEMYSDPPSRALFDMVAVAVLKNPDWGQRTITPAPYMEGESWVERPSNQRKIVVWENFEVDQILDDFFTSMKNPALVY